MQSEALGYSSVASAGTPPAESLADSRHIRFSGLSKRFARKQVLDQVSLELAPGECSLLLGDNGAGKSTLMRIMAGLLRPDAGGADWGMGARRWGAARRSLQDKLVYLHQRPYLFDASVRDNVAFGLPRGRQRRAREARIARAMEWAGLQHLGDVHAGRLSGGERQRVALARAWCRDAPAMLLDEPTANMDTESRTRFLDLIQALVAQGRMLLLATHDPSHFLGLSPRLLRLQQGRLQAVEWAREADPRVLPFTARTTP